MEFVCSIINEIALETVFFFFFFRTKSIKTTERLNLLNEREM